MKISDELDQAMRAYRKGGIKQAELAKLSGVPQPTISRTLKGESVPETKTLIKLAAALKCTLGGYTGKSSLPVTYDTPNVQALKAREPDTLPAHLSEILKLASTMSQEGRTADAARSRGCRKALCLGHDAGDCGLHLPADRKQPDRLTRSFHAIGNTAPRSPP